MVNFLGLKVFSKWYKASILSLFIMHMNVFSEIINSPIIYLKHGQIPCTKNNFEFCGLKKRKRISLKLPTDYAYSEKIYLDNSDFQRAFCKQVHFKINNREVIFTNKEFPLLETLTTCTFIVKSTSLNEYKKINLHFNYYIEDWTSELGNGTEAQKTAEAIINYYNTKNESQVEDDIIRNNGNNICLKMTELLGIDSHNTLNLENEGVKDISPILSLKKLKVLKLQNNNIDFIPESIVELVDLKVIDLSYNNLKNIPVVFLALKNIESIDIAYNKIDFVSADILKSQKFNKTFHGLLDNEDLNGDPIILGKEVYLTPITTNKNEVRKSLYSIINEKSKDKRRKKIDALNIFGKYPTPLIPFDTEMIENINFFATKNLFYIWQHRKCKQLFLKIIEGKNRVNYEHLGDYFDLEEKLPNQCFHEEDNPVKYKLKVLQNSLAYMNLKEGENILREQSLFLNSIWGDIFPDEAFNKNLINALNMQAYNSYGLNAPEFGLKCNTDMCFLYLNIRGNKFLLSSSDYIYYTTNKNKNKNTNVIIDNYIHKYIDGVNTDYCYSFKK